MNFDLISDVHLEELLSVNKSIEELIEEIIIEKSSKYLVFAGDFGYYNFQNIEFVKELKKYYQKILYVYGNNDYKIPFWEGANLEGYTSAKKRVEEFEKELSKIDGLIRLNGNIVELEGFKFGGCDLFYDFVNLKKHFNCTKEQFDNFWIVKELNLRYTDWIEDPYIYAENEKNKLKKIIKEIDVIVTHGCPDYFYDKDDKEIGLFRFDGGEFKKHLKDKVWCYGHKHKRMDEVKYGCRFINASYKGMKNSKIITVKLANNRTFN